VTEPAWTPTPATAADRWKPLAAAIDPRLSTCPAWRALASALDRAQQTGYDVAAHLPRLAAQEPLPDSYPTRALHYRLVDECHAAITPPPTKVRAVAGAQDLRAAPRRSDDQWPVYRADTPGRGPAC